MTKEYFDDDLTDTDSDFSNNVDDDFDGMGMECDSDLETAAAATVKKAKRVVSGKKALLMMNQDDDEDDSEEEEEEEEEGNQNDTHEVSNNDHEVTTKNQVHKNKSSAQSEKPLRKDAGRKDILRNKQRVLILSSRGITQR
jgi:hypothetical protein